ncbi:D-stereospecific peptide hydrolase [Pochonia chlamydosporia 170]|uniref:D-stereospecific peptide hydrolase n=1 Tax=Pochonia chlamydosporia 170 TaxID=1380566 RepID=A0A179FH65_METCM|nr:D-stereospecific peptide hydrolase [Pochonia chlamydosporia 170]OAQ64678.1 D-stereospecific peptide hydrolase [Pochonia chlamydosporia 170]
MPSRDELLTKLKSILQDHITETSTPGLSAAILTPNACHTLTAGQSNLQTQQQIEPFHLFGIGSITKVFTAIVILQLCEEGKLRLSDAVAHHLSSETYAEIDDAADATISQLLGHEAGIDSWEDDPKWITHGRGQTLDPRHIWEKTEPLSYIRRPKRIAPKRGEWYYSNTNYTLLGLIIEKIAQNTAESEIRNRILTPLNLHDIYLEGFETARGALPSRHHWATDTFRSTAGICPSFSLIRDDLIDASTSNLSVEWTAGGMLSSATDLVRFGQALRDGKLLRPESLDVMKKWRTTAPGSEAGRGLFRTKFAGSGGSEYWDGHFGGVLGFTAGLWWAEDGDVVVAVFSNVGTMHAGSVAGSGAHVIMNTGFLGVARELAEVDGGDV